MPQIGDMYPKKGFRDSLQVMPCWCIWFYLAICSAASPVVRVFLFNQDSPELLQDWVLHHTALFGPGSVHIVDHVSSHPVTLATLRLATALGVKVTSRQGHFSHKAALLSEEMRSYRQGADFLLPLDVDEFIGIHREDRFSFRVEEVQAEFARLLPSSHSNRRYKFGMARPAFCDNSSCLSSSTRSPASMRLSFVDSPDSVFDHPVERFCYHKTFFPAAAFHSTDQGNNFGKLRNVTLAASKRNCGAVMKHALSFPRHHALILAHMDSVMPYKMKQEKIVRNARAYGFTLNSKCAGSGHHYCSELQRNSTRQSYCDARINMRCSVNTSVVIVSERPRKK